MPTVWATFSDRECCLFIILKHRVQIQRLNEFRTGCETVTQNGFQQEEKKMDAWNGFAGETWKNEINVRDFIQANYTPYTGDGSFLAGATARTNELMHKLNGLFELEQRFGGATTERK